jgi:hypothetical protein
MNIVIMSFKKMMKTMTLDQILKHLLKLKLNIKMSSEALREGFSSLKTSQIKNSNFMEAMKANKKDRTLLNKTLFKLKKKMKDRRTSILETTVLVFLNFQ